MSSEKTSGNALLTCAHHPNLRWLKTKCGPGYIGRGVLMFEGEVDGKPSNPIEVLTEASLNERPAEYQAWYREAFAVECDCPLTELRLVEYIDD